MNEELLHKFIDDPESLDDAELEELLEALHRDPAAMQTVKAQLHCDDLLSIAANPARRDFVDRVKLQLFKLEEEGDQFVERVLSSVRETEDAGVAADGDAARAPRPQPPSTRRHPSSTRLPRPRRRLGRFWRTSAGGPGLWLAAAAAVLVASVAYLVTSGSPGKMPQTRRGEVAEGDRRAGPRERVVHQMPDIESRGAATAARGVVSRAESAQTRPAADETEPSVQTELHPAEEVAQTRGTHQQPSKAPPTPTETAARSRHFAYLDEVDGQVEFARSGSETWTKANAGLPFSAGDRLRTKLSRARVLFESDSQLYVNRWSTFAFGSRNRTHGLDLTAGQVYVETSKEDKGFWVVTPHGRAVDLGTRFGVETRNHGTTVTVVEGSVDASTDAGHAAVKTQQEVLLVRRVSPPGAVRTVRDVEERFAWAKGGALAKGASAYNPNEIVLLPRHARVAGKYWRLVKDRGASSGVAWEAPPVSGGFLWPTGRNRHLSGFVEYRFRAEGGRWYRLWLRGQCIARRKPVSCDAVCVVPAGADLDRKCPYARHKYLPGAFLYNGLGRRKGYWWIGGDADGGKDAVPVSVRFAQTGTQVLRLYIEEAPIRIDAIWLSTSQATRPENTQTGPVPQKR